MKKHIEIGPHVPERLAMNAPERCQQHGGQRDTIPMTPLPHTRITLGAISIFWLALSAAGQNGGPARLGRDELARQATGLLNAKCLTCHNGNVKSGGIDFSTRASALTARAFTPGNADNSKLVRMVRAGKMPPTGKLPDIEIALLERWVAAGASWPAGDDPRAATFWSLRPVRRPAVPHSPYDAL